MNTTFANLLNGLSEKRQLSEDLYNLKELSKRLETINSITISTDDHYQILPFYICDEGIYEIYWSYITVRSVDSPGIEDHILIETGKKSMEMVDEEIKERVKNLYLEVVTPATTFLAPSLLRCITYIKTSNEVIKDITAAFSRNGKQFKFDENCLYVSVY